jgi:hypothetical protein
MPGRARAPSAGLEEHFLGEIPNMRGAPEVWEQSAEGQGRHQFIQPGLGERVGLVVVRLLVGPIEYPKGVGTVVFDGPEKGRATLSQLLLIRHPLMRTAPSSRNAAWSLAWVLSPLPVQN